MRPVTRIPVRVWEPPPTTGRLQLRPAIEGRSERTLTMLRVSPVLAAALDHVDRKSTRAAQQPPCDRIAVHAAAGALAVAGLQREIDVAHGGFLCCGTTDLHHFCQFRDVGCGFARLRCESGGTARDPAAEWVCQRRSPPPPSKAPRKHPKPVEPDPKRQALPSAVRENADDPPIRIHPVVPTSTGVELENPVNLSYYSLPAVAARRLSSLQSRLRLGLI